MKIYVAARFHEKERVKTIYQKLQEMGHTTTTDWTVCQTSCPIANIKKGLKIAPCTRFKRSRIAKYLSF